MALLDQFQPSVSYDDLAQSLGLNDQDDDKPESNYWAHLDGDDLGTAIIDRAKRFREWQQASGLLRGFRLKQCYYHNEYRRDTQYQHLSLMENYGTQGEYSFVSINHLRSLLKTVISSVVQNPPAFQPISVNADADSMEAAALYQNVLDYYTRDLRLNSRINKAIETAIVVDQGFLLVEWDYFAYDGDAPPGGIWKGAPSVRNLGPLDVIYDVTKGSWADLDYVIVRDWVDKEKIKTQFPELIKDIEACRLRAEVESSGGGYEGNQRYEMTTFNDMSNDIQVFKLFHRSQPWMPNGRFCMVLENGKMLYESPVGMVYPRLPVERFVCDENVDILLGYSPINELLGPQENVNSLVSAITTNAANYSNQYIAVEAGTEISPKTLADGQRIIEYPPGTKPPQGVNLTSIPDSLFKHLQDLMGYMQTVPGVSNASRGQAPGANSTGSAMLFLSSQTSQNQGSMSENYAEFSANVMTSLLHVLRVFGRTEKTIAIMGKNVASRTIVLAEALQDFDSVVVQMTNPVLNTPQGKLAFAQQMMQYGNCTAEQALQVATSGNLGTVTDPVQEMLYELMSENEWLLNGETVMVNAMDNHEDHIKTHTRLFATPWLRKPALAQKLQIQNAPAIQQSIQAHIQQHMQYLGQNQANQTATQAGVQPGQQQSNPSAALGHAPAPQPSPAAPINAPAQGGAISAGTHLPGQPKQPQMPK